MDWVTENPSSGDKSYNACLVILDRYRKTPIFLPCHKDGTAMDTALLIWNRVISHTGLFKSIISDRDLRFTFALWTNLHRLFGKFKDSYGFTHDWCTLIPALEFAYKTSVHSVTGQTPAIHHAKQIINDTFDYAKQKWDKSLKVPDFKVGDLALVSTFNFNNIKGPTKLKDSYVGPFDIVALHRTNAVQVEMSG
ncbi:hypothetical protein O181_043634 [Austropuccinia psidii MF-1]|uniref:Integrase catalytic domain-containing protein n=1 Tax=Austropuccinia psidii MF-1 TaxID=1389203 RepID=A0A9Q3HIL7_9BASI|nr:hypothetical protein [Austropuccinia psidii MF-1]